MASSYLSIPRVRRLEYLVDLLHVVQQAGDKEAIGQKLAERKRSFEVEKSKALGRGRPFMAKLKETARLTSECLNMAAHLGFIEGRNKLNLSLEGRRLVSAPEVAQRTFFIRCVLETYPQAAHVLLLISEQPDGEVVAPLKMNKAIFSETSKRYGLEVDQTTLEVVRDLLSQAELINWHSLLRDGEWYATMYSTSDIRGFPESTAIIEHLEKQVTFAYEGQTFLAVPRQPVFSELKEILWQEYLKAANYVPRRPAFYSQLRSGVCYRLRISDRAFDMAIAKLMRRDDTYLVVGSGGTLPYTRDATRLLKSLPLKSDRGEYVVYLKMDVR